MSRVLIFAGTTEGRELSEILAKSGQPCDVCVATEYGSQMMEASRYITVHQGRLDQEGMRRLYQALQCEIVVDATHPYAALVTDTILKSLEGSKIRYIRLLRPRDDREGEENTPCQYYGSVEECAKGLARTQGRILLTTGSKELNAFCRDPQLRSRLVARVLPGMESLKLCYDNGLEGKQILAMQGPFSKETNLALIRQYDIRHLVTKESGTTGGLNTKLQAAEEAKILTHVIARPQAGNERGVSMEEALGQLEELLGVKLVKGCIHVALVGIGCGADTCMTKEVSEQIAASDYLFGAKRMLSSVSANTNAIRYPFYLKEDILPALEEIKRTQGRSCNVSILFSGDTGFYSGAQKLYAALKEQEGMEVKILSGISSVSALAARIGMGWQDARILSLHGVAEAGWKSALADATAHSPKTFFLTSGVEDVGKIGHLLQKNGLHHVRIFLGYQLSYATEKIYELTPEECDTVTEEGLYVGAIINDRVQKRFLTPNLGDEEFIREKVPMTKEEVRKLSICQMHLAEDSVVYDIGSGTGSIAVQTALLSPYIQVYAIECKEEAVQLIRSNCEKFGTENVTVLQSMAPEGLTGLMPADCAFIGGSRGNLKAILETLRKINPHMRVVMNAVSMESVCEMNELLKQFAVTDLDVAQIFVSKVELLGTYHMFRANNPVFIYSFNLS